MNDVGAFLNTNVSDLVPRGKAGDIFGIELEMEGRNIVGDISPAGWAPHEDGSLRNHHGQAIEWVFRTPVNLVTSVKRVNDLFAYLNKNGARIVCSNRTSTHVHFNMADKKVYQVVNLFVVYTVLEGILTNLCGESRSGNLFCLGVRHAQDIIRVMSRAVFKHHNFRDFGNENRYAGINLSSLNKFGSVEFRCMRGLDNAQDTIDWLNIINELCQFACYKMGKPSAFIEDISRLGCRGLLAEIFSPASLAKLTEGQTDGDLFASMYEGLRLIQMLSYRVSEDWEQNVKVRGKDFWASKAEDVIIEEEDVPVEMPQVRVRPAPRGGIRAAVEAMEQAVRNAEGQAAPQPPRPMRFFDEAARVAPVAWGEPGAFNPFRVNVGGNNE